MVGGEARADKWPQPPQKDLACPELHGEGGRRLHVLDRIEATHFKCDLVGLRQDRRRDRRRDYGSGRDAEHLDLLVGARRRRREGEPSQHDGGCAEASGHHPRHQRDFPILSRVILRTGDR